MSAKIFQFATAPKRAVKDMTSTRVGEDIGDNLPAEVVLGRGGRPLPEPATETARNQRLRLSRRKVWWRANRVRDYWRARMDWHSALSLAQRNGIADSDTFGPAANEEWHPLVDLWRDALVKQMLTPAATRVDVVWKRAQLQGNQWSYTKVKREALEQSIADDIEWFDAHPSRKPRKPAN
jgi:hypothetical protein